MIAANFMGGGRIRFVLVGVITICVAGLAYFAGFNHGRMNEFQRGTSGDLLRTFTMLRDLESNKVSEVKAQLDDNAMSGVILVLTTCNFTTNAEVLAQKPGLRAAAKIWGSTNVPHIQPYDVQFYDLITNRLGLVKDAMDKRRMEKRNLN